MAFDHQRTGAGEERGFVVQWLRSCRQFSFSRLVMRSSFHLGDLRTSIRMSDPKNVWILTARFLLSPCIVESQTRKDLAASLSDLPSMMHSITALSRSDNLETNSDQSILRAARVPGSSASLLRTSYSSQISPPVSCASATTVSSDSNRLRLCNCVAADITSVQLFPQLLRPLLVCSIA